jgi:hypothetical protein
MSHIPEERKPAEKFIQDGMNVEGFCDVMMRIIAETNSDVGARQLAVICIRFGKGKGRVGGADILRMLA